MDFKISSVPLFVNTLILLPQHPPFITVICCPQVLDSVALNTGRETRLYLSSSKWMKRLAQGCAGNSICSAAVCQLVVNWEHVFKWALLPLAS